MKYQPENIWTDEILTRKNLGPTIMNPQNSNENKFSTHEIPTRKLYYIIVLSQNDKCREHIQKR